MPATIIDPNTAIAATIAAGADVDVATVTGELINCRAKQCRCQIIRQRLLLLVGTADPGL